MNRANVQASRMVIGAVILNAIYPLICTLATFALYLVALRGSLDTGQFLAYTAAFTQLLLVVLLLGISFISLVGIVPVYERAVPLLQAALEVDPSRADPGELRGEIRVSHLTFRYEPGGRQILDDVSFDIRPGEAVAFVGPSGAGKSTIFRLLLGFESPESGEIYYDGHSLRNLDPTALRRQLSVVLQNGRVFSGSILQNIVGASSATLEEAWAAARGAGLEEDIKAMPMGMHTYVSEGGVTFSGGQRQRLMIARALVTKPRILLFDEATSSLDNRTQAIVTEGLDSLNATRVFIAQRLSTVMSADRIYVLEAGRVVQQGSFPELMAEPGLFQELARRQLA
jgi:ABC-type bacteriocin/lantibiotic exporter with double-glycine peptidase domain